MILPLQTAEIAKTAQDASAKIIEIGGVFGALFILSLIAIGIIVWYNNKKIIRMQKRVDEVITNHMKTINECSKEGKDMIDRYHLFVNELKNIFYHKEK